MGIWICFVLTLTRTTMLNFTLWQKAKQHWTLFVSLMKETPVLQTLAHNLPWSWYSKVLLTRYLPWGRVTRPRSINFMTQILFDLDLQWSLVNVGHCGLRDRASASYPHDAKGPGIKSPWRQKLYNCNLYLLLKYRL